MLGGDSHITIIMNPGGREREERRKGQAGRDKGERRDR